jgi:hypothetical protein
MAVSHINMECKRYGCMKNLLACYANCRYNGRCEDLRTEVVARSDQATKDINDYLRERGRAPITIQVMKRGLRFADAPRHQVIQKNTEDKKPVALLPKTLNAKKGGEPKIAAPKAESPAARRPRRKKRKLTRASTHTVRTVTSKQVSDFTKRDPKQPRKQQRNRMARKTVREESIKKQERAESPNAPLEERGSSAMAKVARPGSGSNRKRREPARNAQPARKNGKLFIILDGKTANLVDEQGLIAHLLANNSPGTRYFEASEVEARLQIVPKR